MREVGVLEAKTHFSELLADVEKGAEIVVTRHGKPVARIVSAAPRQRPGPEIADQIRQIREAAAQASGNAGDFDWKAAVEEGRR